jgi:hypothetical protein
VSDAESRKAHRDHELPACGKPRGADGEAAAGVVDQKVQAAEIVQ